MKYCPKCGFEIPEYGNFCPECGTSVHDKFGTLNYENNTTLPTKNDSKNGKVLQYANCAACIEKFDLSPAEFTTLIYRPTHLENFFKSPYRVTLFYFILKCILELEIRSSRLILLNMDHVTVKKGPLFEKFISAPFKSYESIMLDAFRFRDSFIVDTYEKGPLSYKFESKTFKNLFFDELINRDFFEFEKRSIAGFGAKKYILTDYGESVREAILGELGYDLEERLSELDTPADYLCILTFFGLDEGMMHEELSKIQTLHRKLTVTERAYEGKRTGYGI